MPNQNLARNLSQTAEEHPERPALFVGHNTTTYAQLDEATARLAGLLRGMGIGPGDRVGVMLPNVPEFATVYYGVLRAGATVVPMNILLKHREVAFYLSDSGAKLVFAQPRRAPVQPRPEPPRPELSVSSSMTRLGQLLAAAEPEATVAERAGEDTAVILYTSGTTGKPKGAELTHANLTRNAEVSVGLFDAGPDEVILGALPPVPRLRTDVLPEHRGPGRGRAGARAPFRSR